jgi:hypothetical protein
LITATLTLTPLAWAQGNVPEPEGYRTDNYRVAVPATLAGARVLTTEEAEVIWHTSAGVFIDVLPHPPKPQRLPRRRHLAREAATQHSRQRLAAGHGLWDACGVDRRLSAARTCACRRR